MEGMATSAWECGGVVTDVRHIGTGSPVQPEGFAVRSQFLGATPKELILIPR
jgi:hypothetical protein